MSLILSLVIGVIVGSFLNVVIWRLPRSENINGRSHCPNCGYKLHWWELVPVISWLVLSAKCKSCRTRIHWRYPAIEVVTALLFALSWIWLGVDFWSLNYINSLEVLRLWLICALAVVVFVVDLEHYLILDKVVISGGLGLIVLATLRDAVSGSLNIQGLLVSGLLMAVILAALFGALWYFSNGKWLGFGDVKFMLPFGLALGFPLGFLGLGLASILGAVTGVGLLVFSGANLKTRLPFGVFLSVALVIAALFGQEVWQFYLNWVENLFNA